MRWMADGRLWRRPSPSSRRIDAGSSVPQVQRGRRQIRRVAKVPLSLAELGRVAGAEPLLVETRTGPFTPASRLTVMTLPEALQSTR
jgi:hypothetical protein